ncbi:MAG: tetratricopeptide repeat protein [Caldilineaceae bacterium]
MTEPTQVQPSHSLHGLRNALEQAERQLVRLDRENIVAFLVGLDQIDAMFTGYGQDQSAVRAEEGRWESLQKRITAKPKLVVNAANNAGGLAKLGSQYAPALGFWWHLDAAVAQRRTQTMQRVGLAIGAIAVVGLLWWGYTIFFPAVASPADATTTIEQLVAAQQLPDALAAVTNARQTAPDDPELLIWEAVLNEQVGNTAQAQTALAQAEQTFVGQPAAFWRLVGTKRQQVGNLPGAAEAGQQALALAPEDAQNTFLLGSVAEASGNTVQAAAYFSQTIALADDENPELGVMAKTRMGYLMPSLEPLPNPAPAETITNTVTPKSP